MRFGLQQIGLQLQAVVEAITGVQRAGQVTVAVGIVFIATAANRLDVDPVGIRTAEAEAVPTPVVASGNPGTAGVAVVGTVAGGEKRLGPRTAALAGENLDHPTDGLRAVQAGTWSAHHLDTFDQLQRQILQRRATGAYRTDLDAIDHHQHVVGLGATHEQRSGLARPAIIGKRHARHFFQQLGNRSGLALLDLRTVEYRHRCQALLRGLHCTGGGYHLLLQIEGQRVGVSLGTTGNTAQH
ncbi:hypothetical protein D9M68_626800 [compost metagenome]